MVRITKSKNNSITDVDDDCIISFEDLLPYYKSQCWEEFPLLKHNVYKWSKKNKCTYLRTYYLPAESTKFVKAIIFKDSDKAKQFKAKWLDSLLHLRGGVYEFTGNAWKYNPVSSLDTPIMKKWLKKQKIKLITTGYRWILFDSTKSAMMFKIRWM